jgi:hypothetical protein
LRFASLLLCAALSAKAAGYFEPNRGQAPMASPFLVPTAKGFAAAGPNGVTYLRNDGSLWRIVFVGASARAEVNAEDPLPGVSHYVRGRDPAGWVQDVPHYGMLRCRGVYPGIDVLYHANGAGIEFDFLVGAKGDPSRIRFTAPAGARFDASGNLIFGDITIHAPVAWQNANGARSPVSARFILGGRSVSFAVGRFDRSRPLTIDPLIQFATFLGGTGDDVGLSVLASADGAIYTAGETTSANFPASLPGTDALNHPENLFVPTAYVSKLKGDLSAIDWSVFAGGSARQSVLALRQDSLGNLYMLGQTTSVDFPVTPGAWRSAIDPSLSDLYLLKLDAATGHVLAGTYLGVAQSTGQVASAARLAIDVAGGVYIGGYRSGSDVLPVTTGAVETSGSSTQFVIRLNSALTAAAYLTYWPLGTIDAMDVDGAGNLLIGGVANGPQGTGPSTFTPVNPLPGIDQTSTGVQAYIARLNATGSAVTFASLLHGDGGSGITDLKFGGDGSINLAGWGAGANFPQVNSIAIDPLPSGYPPPGVSTDSPFLAKLTPDAKSIAQSTYFYGPDYSASQGLLNKNLRLALLPGGAICIAGLQMAISNQSPGGLVLPSNTFNPVAWSLSCTDPADSSIALKTGMPATGGQGYTDIAVASDGSLLFTGSAGSGFSTTPGVVQPNPAGGGPSPFNLDPTMLFPGDSFIMRVGLANPAPTIESANPDSIVIDAGAGGTCSLGLIGSNFAYGATATINGQPTALTITDTAHAATAFNCSAWQPGDNNVVVSVPPPGGGSGAKIVPGLNAPPYTISVSPASVVQGAGETKLVIRAENLTAGSTLYWNGAPRNATFVADTGAAGHFELLLEPTDLAQPALAQITVTNPPPGGGVSAPAAFTVEPAAGVGVPVLTPPPPFLLGGATPLGPQLSVAGSGFTSHTQILWDGASVPVAAFTATGISFTPPASDLTHWSSHTVSAVDGGFQSPAVQALVGITATPQIAAYDPGHSILYVVSSGAGNLSILDGATGSSLGSLPAIVSSPGPIALSADGRYLYLAENPSFAQPQVVRYNTQSGVVDLHWQIPSLSNMQFRSITSLVTPPDSPDTVMVSTTDNYIVIYDHGQARGAPAPLAGPAFFASSSRIYAAGSSASAGPCWLWLNYDAFGFSGGQMSCGPPPAELQSDSGVDYLTDGIRTYVVAEPNAGGVGDFVADVTHREAWQLGGGIFGLYYLFEYNMDTQQLRSIAQLSSGSPYGASPAIYSTGNGAVLVVIPNFPAGYIVLVR